MTMLNHEAGTIVKDMLRSDYFQSFTDKDRVYDPNGLYALEADLEDSEDSNLYQWSDEQREALLMVANMSPDERANYLEIALNDEAA